MYAVLLGFVVIVTWQQFDESRAGVEAEASAINDVYSLAGVYGSRGSEVRSRAEQFVAITLNQEWPAMYYGGNSEAAGSALLSLGRAVLQLQARNAREGDVFSRALDKVTRIADLRRKRLAANRNTLPPAMWACLCYIGAILTITFGYLFGVEQVRVQMLMTSAVAAAIAIQLFLAIELDYPFRGSISVAPTAYVDVQREFATGRYF